MCGILGFTSYGESVPQEAMVAFEEMFINTQARGKDASGFAYIKDGALVVAKTNKPANQILSTAEWTQLKEDNPKMVIAHTRLKTQGTEKNNRNNHPVYDPKFGWAVVHNGTIYNDTELFKKLQLQRDGEVDTEIILRMFQHYMVKSVRTTPDIAMKQAVGKIKGAMTFAMIGEEDDNLYLYKGCNPLSVVVVPEWKMVFFASVYKHIAEALTSLETMCDGFVTKLGAEKEHYSSDKIEEGTLICISVDKGQPKVRTLRAPQPEEAPYQYKSVGKQYDFEGERFKVGVSHIQNADGTIERIGGKTAQEKYYEDGFFVGE